MEVTQDVERAIRRWLAKMELEGEELEAAFQWCRGYVAAMQEGPPTAARTGELAVSAWRRAQDHLVVDPVS